MHRVERLKAYAAAELAEVIGNQFLLGLHSPAAAGPRTNPTDFDEILIRPLRLRLGAVRFLRRKDGGGDRQQPGDSDQRQTDSQEFVLIDHGLMSIPG